MNYVDRVIRILPSGETVAQNLNKPVSVGTFQALSPDMTQCRPPAAGAGVAPVVEGGAIALYKALFNGKVGV